MMNLAMENKVPALPVGRSNSPVGQGATGKLTDRSLHNGQLAITTN